MKIFYFYLVAFWVLTVSIHSFANQDNEIQVGSFSDNIILQYYYLSTCPYCQKMEPVLAKLRQKTGIRIQPMSLDGQPMSFTNNGSAIRFYDGRQFAMAYGITSTPTLIVFEPPNNYTVLSTGFLSYENLLAYLASYGDQRGLID